MRKTMRRVLIWTTATQVVIWVVGQLVSRRLSRGDADSDDFRVAGICGGRKFRSHAQQLRSASVLASMGGVDLDLREARLDPAGATLDVNATMGGVQVTIPREWAVELDPTAAAGGVEAKVTPREDLPADAPTLHVRARTRMGGALITSAS